MTGIQPPNLKKIIIIKKCYVNIFLKNTILAFRSCRIIFKLLKILTFGKEIIWEKQNIFRSTHLKWYFGKKLKFELNPPYLETAGAGGADTLFDGPRLLLQQDSAHKHPADRRCSEENESRRWSICTRPGGYKENVVYLGWPIASRIWAQMRREGVELRALS